VRNGLTGPIATIDTSVFLSLQCTGTIGNASVLFSRLLVPVAVRDEIEAGGERNAAAVQALADYALFEVCDDYDSASVEFLLQQRAQQAVGRNQGEAEAVAQAAQRAADMVLVDDALGREWGQGYVPHLPRHTLGVRATSDQRICSRTAFILHRVDP